MRKTRLTEAPSRGHRQRFLARLGVAISASVLLLSLVQNVIWSPLSGYAVP